jgi:hypothetical protein
VPVPRPPAANAATVKAVEARTEAAKKAAPAESPAAGAQPVAAGDLKDALLAEIRKVKKFFYGTVVAQAQRIDVEPERVIFTFGPQHRALRDQLDGSRAELETLATRLAGRRMAVISAENGSLATPAVAHVTPGAAPPPDRQAELRKQAMSDTGVQAMLDVFAAEIKDVEEM